MLELTATFCKYKIESDGILDLKKALRDSKNEHSSVNLSSSYNHNRKTLPKN